MSTGNSNGNHDDDKMLDTSSDEAGSGDESDPDVYKGNEVSTY